MNKLDQNDTMVIIFAIRNGCTANHRNRRIVVAGRLGGYFQFDIPIKKPPAPCERSVSFAI
jgi:hypothetical protein